MKLSKPLTLASKSRIRATLLAEAGLTFETCDSRVDEDAIKRVHTGTADELALALAAAKARAAASDGRIEGLILAADQVLECEGRLFDKPKDMQQARANLDLFCGRTHYLVNGLVLAEGGEIVWSHSARVGLTMRDFSDAFLDVYLQEVGDKILSSVGCYQLEGLGVQLFERIDGDNFAIMGLPLLPLLQALRQHAGLPA